MLFSDQLGDVKAFAYTTIIFLICYWLWHRRHLYLFALNFPGSFGLPIVGILYKIGHPNYILSFITKHFDDIKSNTLCTWFGIYPLLFTQDPVLAEKVLSSPKFLNKAMPMYAPANHALQGGIISSPASEWRSHRKYINPAFKQAALLSFLPIFNKAKNKMIERFGELSKLENENDVSLSNEIQTIMLGVASETMMGKENNKTDSQKILNSFINLLRILTAHTLLAFFNIHRIVKYHGSYNKYLHTLHHFLKDSLQQKIHEDDKKSSLIELENTEDEKPKIFVDTILRLWREQKFSWTDVISESNNLLIASIETTANALFAAVVMLAMHPPVQEQLYEEIQKAIENNGNNTDVDYELLKNLTYLDMVVQETLRLAPSVPIIGRQVIEETEISEGIIVPKGMQIVISIFHLHRNKEFWGPNADKFNPENFSTLNQKNRQPNAYMPFSKGNRNCIGYRYAMLALKTMLIGLVYNYRFETEFKYEDLEFVENMTLSMLRQPAIKIKSRN